MYKINAFFNFYTISVLSVVKEKEELWYNIQNENYVQLRVWKPMHMFSLPIIFLLTQALMMVHVNWLLNPKPESIPNGAQFPIFPHDCSTFLESSEVPHTSLCFFMLTQLYVTPCKLHTDGLHTIPRQYWGAGDHATHWRWLWVLRVGREPCATFSMHCAHHLPLNSCGDI